MALRVIAVGLGRRVEDQSLAVAAVKETTTWMAAREMELAGRWMLCYAYRQRRASRHDVARGGDWVASGLGVRRCHPSLQLIIPNGRRMLVGLQIWLQLPSCLSLGLPAKMFDFWALVELAKLMTTADHEKSLSTPNAFFVLSKMC